MQFKDCFIFLKVDTLGRYCIMVLDNLDMLKKWESEGRKICEKIEFYNSLFQNIRFIFNEGDLGVCFIIIENDMKIIYPLSRIIEIEAEE